MKGPVRAYKGMTWQKTSEFRHPFKVGETYECEQARIRKSGFHACLNPYHILDYSSPYHGRVCEVELDGQIDSCDHMLCGTKMKIIRQLTDREIIEAFIAHKDFRTEAYEVIFSDEDEDDLYGEMRGLIVHSTGKKAWVEGQVDCMYVLSDGDDAHIVSEGWSMNSLILSYGNNAHIESVSSARIEVYGKGTEVLLTGTNHAIKFSEGTELHYDRKVLIAGTDFKADTYYVTKNGKLELMRRKAPEVEKFSIEE
jgi:hypothetical protein